MIPAKYSIMLNDIKDIPIIQDVLNNYTIYDNNYRNTLNNKILNHYAYEEIGFETPALFAHYLKVKLDEIMPKYNKLYESELLKLDPLSNYTIKESLEKEGEQTSLNTQNSTNSNNQTSTSTTDGENNSTSSSTNNTTSSQNLTSKENHIFQNTPQGDVKFETIDNYDHATTHNIDGTTENTTGTKNSTISATDTTTSTTENTTENIINATGNISENGKINTTEEYTKLIVGNRDISTTKLYNEFINNYISIDKLIIDELQDLFMLIY